MKRHERIDQTWAGFGAIVAATGPSLDAGVAELCRYAQRRGTHKVIAVNDAYRLMPWADVLYSCDGGWWDYHRGAPQFAGERWSSTSPIDKRTRNPDVVDDKTYWAEKYHLNLVIGALEDGFSSDPTRIHYGGNSGFQAVNLALLRAARPVVLVGFNLQCLDNKTHFFGDHPRELRKSDNYARFVPQFKEAARRMPPGMSIINATPFSALTCFPFMPLERALMLELEGVA